MKKLKSFLSKNILYFAWAQALSALLGSLYFSEILHYVPCVLCWYQRILFYPLVFILAVGILKKDKKIADYVLPFSILGIGVAFYHVLLQEKIIPESLAPCVDGVSCTTEYLRLFSFITIPFLSLLGFLFITTCMLIFSKTQQSSSGQASKIIIKNS